MHAMTFGHLQGGIKTWHPFDGWVSSLVRYIMFAFLVLACHFHKVTWSLRRSSPADVQTSSVLCK